MKCSTGSKTPSMVKHVLILAHLSIELIAKKKILMPTKLYQLELHFDYIYTKNKEKTKKL